MTAVKGKVVSKAFGAIAKRSKPPTAGKGLKPPKGGKKSSPLFDKSGPKPSSKMTKGNPLKAGPGKGGAKPTRSPLPGTDVKLSQSKSLTTSGPSSKAKRGSNAAHTAMGRGAARTRKVASAAGIRTPKAVKPVKTGFRAGRKGATNAQVKAGGGGKRMRAGAVVGRNPKKAAGAAGAGGLLGAGSYETSKRKTKSGKVVTNRRKK